jgi:nucleotide-binding universal stress UspA family protein
MMFRKILVATDGSTLSQRAIATAVDLARSLGASLVGVTAVDAYPYAGVGQLDPLAYGEFQARAAAEAFDRLATLESAARAAGIPCEALSRQGAPPWRAILDTAAEQGCDAIVMASHGRAGVSALILGSETQHVLSQTTLPVIVVR